MPCPSQTFPGIAPGGTNPAGIQRLRPGGFPRDTRWRARGQERPRTAPEIQRGIPAPLPQPPALRPEFPRLQAWEGRGEAPWAHPEQGTGECPAGMDTQRDTGTHPHSAFPGKGLGGSGERDERGRRLRVLLPGRPGLLPVRFGAIRAGPRLRGGPAAVNRSPAPGLGERNDTEHQERRIPRLGLINRSVNK